MKAIEELVRAEAAQGRIAYQSCRACGTVAAFPRPFCPSCGSADIEYLSSEGRGRVAAVTTLHRAPTLAHKERLPYSVALVDLEEGIRVMGGAAEGLAVGDAVTAQSLEFDGAPLIHFIPFDRTRP
ncbi:DNA-binding protein [Acuticoccus sediminis]|uniref:DNA-binding protein n=1 Tax=Acuticoccus sediminis TaxID=2184697 RepID=A0A8B2NS40_9HYPH|nr:OB-fold domain-containing protein [Acuticoccus sediminis]RAH99026.1 DNA-binding protein [Acuticoccus sediminis]